MLAWPFYPSGKPTISPASKRVGSLVRPTTPKSSVPKVSTFESIEDSDDDVDLASDSKNDDAVYVGSNGAIVSARCICLHKQYMMFTFVYNFFISMKTIPWSVRISANFMVIK
jgi:hypothetical protein